MALSPREVGVVARARKEITLLEKYIDKELTSFLNEGEENSFVKQKGNVLEILLDDLGFEPLKKTQEVISLLYVQAGWREPKWRLGGMLNGFRQILFSLTYPEAKLLQDESAHCIPSKNPRRGFVYLFKCNGRYKIGRSKNPTKRMAKMAGAIMPFEIERIHAIPCKDAHTTEFELHSRFATKREKGEWFSLDESDLAYIKSLLAA